jgi:YD repeat-containing protein
MESYVYNNINHRLLAKLDANNFATFYEYDKEGNLIRVKRETEIGIVTLKEIRQSTVKYKRKSDGTF